MEKKPALEATLVQEFVISAHGDLDRTREFLAQEPALVNATWDWGGGDFETALGGAAHMEGKTSPTTCWKTARVLISLPRQCSENWKSSKPRSLPTLMLSTYQVRMEYR